jgi:hypothetical protein
MLVKAIGFHGNTERVVEGGVYTVVRVEEGIFPDRPYVTVKDADGREHSGFHLTRFALLDAIGNGEE